MCLHNMNNMDLFNLLEILSEPNSSAHEKRGKAVEYAKKYKVASTVLMTVAGAANCNIDYSALAQKGESMMYSVFEETRAEGMSKGLTEGMAKSTVKMGLKFHLTKEQILEELQDSLNIPLQKAEEYFQIYQNQTETFPS